MIKAFENLESKLKELGLEEEQIKGIVDFEKHNIPKDFMPSDDFKSKLSEKESKIEELNNQLEETNNSLSSLKENDDSEKLKEKLQDIQNEYTTFKENVGARESTRKKKDIFRDNLIEKGFNPKAVRLLESQADFETMQLKEDKIIGINEHLESLEKEYSFLKVKSNVKGEEPPNGNNDDEPNPDDMSDDEYYKWKQTK